MGRAEFIGRLSNVYIFFAQPSYFLRKTGILSECLRIKRMEYSEESAYMSLQGKIFSVLSHYFFPGKNTNIVDYNDNNGFYQPAYVP